MREAPTTPLVPHPSDLDLGDWCRREVLPRLTAEVVYGEDGVRLRRCGAYLARPCPLHGGDDPNFHVHPEHLGWRCHSVCQDGGDVIGYVRRRHGLDFPAAVRFLAELAGLEVPGRGAAPARRRPSKVDRSRSPAPRAAPAPKVYGRPPVSEVEALWNAGGPVTAEELGPDGAAFVARKIGASLEALADTDFARLLPLPGAFPFPAWFPARWARTWRLAVPAYEADGRLAALHVRAVAEGADPKTRWPLSLERYAYGELLFADLLGLATLRGEPVTLEGLVVAEGLTDTLATALWALRSRRALGVLGITSGGAPALARVKWPAGVPCFLAVDQDPTGDKYAAEVRAALPARVTVRRMDLAATVKGAA